MTMTPQAMDALIDAHLAAEIAKDVAATLATFAPDAVHDVGGASAPTVGHEQIGSFYRRVFSELTIKELGCLRRLHGADFAVDDSMATCVADGHPFGFDGRGREFRCRLLHVFEFADGKIQRENSWADMTAIAVQLS